MMVMNEREEIDLRKKLRTMFNEFKINKEPIIDPEFITPVSTDIITIIEEYIEMKYVK